VSGISVEPEMSPLEVTFVIVSELWKEFDVIIEMSVLEVNHELDLVAIDEPLHGVDVVVMIALELAIGYVPRSDAVLELIGPELVVEINVMPEMSLEVGVGMSEGNDSRSV
jgi:hypothetical protein